MAPYLVPNLEVLTLLGAATQLLVEALVDEAVELVRAVGAVVVVVAEQRLGDAIPVLAEEEGVVALVFCREEVAVISRGVLLSPPGPHHDPSRYLGCCSVGSWVPHPSGRGSRTPRRIPTAGC